MVVLQSKSQKKDIDFKFGKSLAQKCALQIVQNKTAKKKTSLFTLATWIRTKTDRTKICKATVTQ